MVFFTFPTIQPKDGKYTRNEKDPFSTENSGSKTPKFKQFKFIWYRQWLYLAEGTTRWGGPPNIQDLHKWKVFFFFEISPTAGYFSSVGKQRNDFVSVTDKATVSWCISFPSAEKRKGTILMGEVLSRWHSGQKGIKELPKSC